MVRLLTVAEVFLKWNAIGAIHTLWVFDLTADVSGEW